MRLKKLLTTKRHLTDCKKLIALLRIANCISSDALANFFMIEAILRDKDWCMPNLSNIYKESPAQISKVPVANKNNFKISKDGMKIVEP